MDLSIVFDDLTKVLNRLEGAEKIISEEKENMAYEVGEIAADAMRSKIERSGTAFSRAAQKVGLNQGPGRIRDSKLYNSIDYEVFTYGDYASTEVGYLNDYEKYFEAQEGGFETGWKASYDRKGQLRLNKDGTPRVRFTGEMRKVRGIFALRAAKRAVDQEFSRLQKKYRSRITKRINGSS